MKRTTQIKKIWYYCIISLLYLSFRKHCDRWQCRSVSQGTFKRVDQACRKKVLGTYPSSAGKDICNESEMDNVSSWCQSRAHIEANPMLQWWKNGKTSIPEESNHVKCEMALSLYLRYLCIMTKVISCSWPSVLVQVLTSFALLKIKVILWWLSEDFLWGGGYLMWILCNFPHKTLFTLKKNWKQSTKVI